MFLKIPFILQLTVACRVWEPSQPILNCINFDPQSIELAFQKKSETFRKLTYFDLDNWRITNIRLERSDYTTVCCSLYKSCKKNENLNETPALFWYNTTLFGGVYRNVVVRSFQQITDNFFPVFRNKFPNPYNDQLMA